MHWYMFEIFIVYFGVLAIYNPRWCRSVGPPLTQHSATETNNFAHLANIGTMVKKKSLRWASVWQDSKMAMCYNLVGLIHHRWTGIFLCFCPKGHYVFRLSSRPSMHVSSQSLLMWYLENEQLYLDQTYRDYWEWHLDELIRIWVSAL